MLESHAEFVLFILVSRAFFINKTNMVTPMSESTSEIFRSAYKAMEGPSASF